VINRAAIIGAGIAGLSCARTLRLSGFHVEVFEEDRTIGGRIATTRIGSDTFDHGAQYVSAHSQDFAGFLNEASKLGYAGHWAPRTGADGHSGNGGAQPWLVGTPGMSSLVRPLAEGIRVNAGRRVHALERRGIGWHVWFEDETSVGPFQAVAVATPAPQARLLLGRLEDLAEPLSRTRMLPCWTLMVRLESKILPEQDIFSGLSDVIHWLARNNTKPGRNSSGECVVVHGSSDWSREAEDFDSEAVAEELWSEVSHLLSLPPIRPSHMTAHLWRDGLVDQPLGQPCLYSPEHKAGLAGDWCLGRSAEDAFASGAHLGRAIADSLA
jgi:hypothetical protein